MPKNIEWRISFYIAVPSKGRSTIEVPFDGSKKSTGMMFVRECKIDDPDHSFKLVNSDLLVAIDKDNVHDVATAFLKTKLDVNQKYVVPHWEVPEAYPWPGQYIESFLNRAVEAGAQKTFYWLLVNGADPRAKNYLGHSVIEQIIDHNKLSRDEKANMGKALVDFGLTLSDIPSACMKAKLAVHTAKTCVLDIINRYAQIRQKD